MGFLRRLLGGTDASDDAPGDLPAPAASPPTAADLVAEEQERERELLREDALRLDNELIQRQLFYADRSWTPPAQGGTRRADDEDANAERPEA